MNYKDKLAIYSQPETDKKWLIQIKECEYKKCTGDLFKHYYLGGPAFLIEDLKNLKVDVHIKTRSLNVRKKNLEFLDEPSLELKSLFF